MAPKKTKTKKQNRKMKMFHIKNAKKKIKPQFLTSFDLNSSLNRKKSGFCDTFSRFTNNSH